MRFLSTTSGIQLNDVMQRNRRQMWRIDLIDAYKSWKFNRRSTQRRHNRSYSDVGQQFIHITLLHNKDQSWQIWLTLNTILLLLIKYFDVDFSDKRGSWYIYTWIYIWKQTNIITWKLRWAAVPFFVLRVKYFITVHKSRKQFAFQTWQRIVEKLVENSKNWFSVASQPEKFDY